MAQQIKKKFLSPEVINYFDDQINSVESSVLSEQSRAQGQEAAIRSEFAAVDTVLGGRLDSLETINGFIRGSLYNDSIGVYGSAQPGVEDPSITTRDGWYYQNTVAGQSISWYYHDGVSYPTTKAQLKNTFAVMTFDDKTAKPIFALYSMPTGSNDVMPGFAHSKWVFQVPTASMSSVVLGKKYLVHAGDVSPTIHPELPRLQATFVSAVSGGQMLSSENISTVSLISDGSVAVNKVKWLVESVGIHSESFKYEGKLVIRHATKAALDAEVSARTSANTSINSAIALKAATTYVDSQDTAKLVEAKAYTDAQIAAIPAVDLSNFYTKSQVDSKETALDGKISTEKGRIDAILSASQADKDTFAEIVTLINSIDTANDQAFAGYVLSNDAALAQEISDRQAADSAEVLARDAAISVSVMAEQQSRELFDGMLDAKIDQEISDRQSQVQGVATSLMGTIGAVNDSLLQEISDRASGDSSTLSSANSYTDAQIAAIPSVDLSNYYNKTEVDSGFDGVESLISSHDSRITALEALTDGPSFSNGSVVVGAELGFIELDKQYIKLMSVAVGRMAVHEGEDFTVSVVGGKTRLTWINSLANPSGEEKIETGDKVFFVGAF